MNVKLTKEIRLKIQNRLIEHAFSEQVKEWHKQEAELGDKIYRDLYPEGLRRKIAALPEGIVATTNYLQVAFGGQVDRVGLSKDRRIGANHIRGTVLNYSTSHEFSKTHLDLEAAAESLRNRKDRARSEIRAVLASVRTLKQLLEVWPEAKPFVQDLEVAEQVSLSVPIKELNAQLGLGGRS
jgi:hypothetical protein